MRPQWVKDLEALSLLWLQTLLWLGFYPWPGTFPCFQERKKKKKKLEKENSYLRFVPLPGNRASNTPHFLRGTEE